MSSSSLIGRVADFLVQHPPYSFLGQEVVFELASQVQIRFYERGAVIFEVDDSPGEALFLLHKGEIELFIQSEEKEVLIDKCDIGESFGVRPLLTGLPHQASARATADCLVYLIPWSAFQQLMAQEAKVASFYAAGFAAGKAIVKEQPAAAREARRALLANSYAPSHFQEKNLLQIEPNKEIISCTEDTSIQEASRSMRTHKISSLIILDKERKPIGILSTTDITRKVVADGLDISGPVKGVMSSPVITIGQETVMGEVILKMMRHNIRHLAVTEDGTPNSPIKSVVSERDVLMMEGNNPAILVKQIMKAQQVSDMARVRKRAHDLIHNYLLQEVSIPFVADMITEINDALIVRAIQLEVDRLTALREPPPQPFCWLSFGSEGRREQLLLTDQDNGIVYEDPPAAEAEATAAYFLKLGKAVTDTLEACGFAHCPAEIMASNPKWNQPLSQWKTYFEDWIRVPNSQALMHATIFFDFRAGAGDFSLAKRLRDFIQASIEKYPSFINFLAKNALGNPPPLSFFKQFVLERSGEHKNQFDLKKRGMMPLADAARVLVYYTQTEGVYSTFKRFEALAARDENMQETFEEAGLAYEWFMRFRALQGFKHGGSGRYLEPQELNKLERQMLKTAFQVIEDIQLHLTNRFNLRMIY